MGKITDYVNESKSELKKVQWPSRQETIRHTVMVIGISLGIAAFLGIFDYIFSWVIELLIT